MPGAAGPNGHYCWPEPGFTKREEIAVRLMAAAEARGARLSRVEMADSAVRGADALISALRNIPEGDGSNV